MCVCVCVCVCACGRVAGREMKVSNGVITNPIPHQSRISKSHDKQSGHMTRKSHDGLQIQAHSPYMVIVQSLRHTKLCNVNIVDIIRNSDKPILHILMSHSACQGLSIVSRDQL